MYYQQDSERLQDGGPEPNVLVWCEYCEKAVTLNEEDECSNCGTHIPDAMPTCTHGYPQGRGCQICEQWEAADYHRDRLCG